MKFLVLGLLVVVLVLQVVESHNHKGHKRHFYKTHNNALAAGSRRHLKEDLTAPAKMKVESEWRLERARATIVDGSENAKTRVEQDDDTSANETVTVDVQSGGDNDTTNITTSGQVVDANTADNKTVENQGAGGNGTVETQTEVNNTTNANGTDTQEQTVDAQTGVDNTTTNSTDASQFVIDPDNSTKTAEEKKKAEEEKKKAEEEKKKAEEEKKKAEEDKAKAEADKAKAEADKAKAEADKNKAEADKNKAEADKTKAEEDKTKAEKEKAEADKEKTEDGTNTNCNTDANTLCPTPAVTISEQPTQAIQVAPAPAHTVQTQVPCCQSLDSAANFPVWPTDFSMDNYGANTDCNCPTCSCGCIVIPGGATAATPQQNYNNLCYRRSGINPRIEWSNKGPIPGKRCTPAPLSTYGQKSKRTFLCVPKNSPYHFIWSVGLPPNLQNFSCLQMAGEKLYENFLCAKKINNEDTKAHKRSHGKVKHPKKKLLRKKVAYSGW